MIDDVVLFESKIAAEIERYGLSVDTAGSSKISTAFDAEEIHMADDYLLDKARNPSNHSESKRTKLKMLMSNSVRDEWAKRLKSMVISRNFVAVDNHSNLQVIVDLILQVEMKRYACKFYHVTNPVFEKILEKGPLKKNVTAVVVGAGLIACHDGLLFYQHGNRSKVFHIKYSEDILKFATDKSSALYQRILLGD